MKKQVFDVLVRVTVTADDRTQARRLVSRFLPKPSNSTTQPAIKSSTTYDARVPNYPIDSWALLTEEKVVDTESTPTRDRVLWTAVEVS